MDFNYKRKEKGMNFLIQPKKYQSLMADEGSRAIIEEDY